MLVQLRRPKPIGWVWKVSTVVIAEQRKLPNDITSHSCKRVNLCAQQRSDVFGPSRILTLINQVPLRLINETSANGMGEYDLCKLKIMKLYN